MEGLVVGGYTLEACDHHSCWRQERQKVRLTDGSRERGHEHCGLQIQVERSGVECHMVWGPGRRALARARAFCRPRLCPPSDSGAGCECAVLLDSSGGVQACRRQRKARRCEVESEAQRCRGGELTCCWRGQACCCKKSKQKPNAIVGESASAVGQGKPAAAKSKQKHNAVAAAISPAAGEGKPAAAKSKQKHNAVAAANAPAVDEGTCLLKGERCMGITCWAYLYPNSQH